MVGHTHSGTTSAMGRSGMEKLTEAIARSFVASQREWEFSGELHEQHRARAREIVAAVEAAGFRIVRK
jgi:hypothetical protein